MKSRYVMLKYAFMFNPADAWSNLYEFESTLAKYLEGIGFDAEIIKGIEGQSSERILLIKKKDPLMMQQQTQKEKPLNKVVNELRDKKRYG